MSVPDAPGDACAGARWCDDRADLAAADVIDDRDGRRSDRSTVTDARCPLGARQRVLLRTRLRVLVLRAVAGQRVEPRVGVGGDVERDGGADRARTGGG